MRTNGVKRSQNANLGRPDNWELAKFKQSVENNEDKNKVKKEKRFKREKVEERLEGRKELMWRKKMSERRCEERG